jgi:hypothetical protein
MSIFSDAIRLFISGSFDNSPRPMFQETTLRTPDLVASNVGFVEPVELGTEPLVYSEFLLDPPGHEGPGLKKDSVGLLWC